MIMRGRTYVFATAALLAPALALADDEEPVSCPQDNAQGSDQSQENCPPQTAQAEPAPATEPPSPIVTPPPPANTQPMVEERVYDVWNLPLFTASFAVFAASYGGSAIVASGSPRIGDNRLWYPVIGPWWALSDRTSCNTINPNCSNSTSDKALLVIDGVAQAAGVLGMVSAFIWPTSHRVERVATYRVVPTAGTDHAGIVVVGSF